MPVEPYFAEIPGAQDLFDWFGHWPSFHDGEILSLELHRRGPSRLRIHTWALEPPPPGSIHFSYRKPVVVEFALHGISDLELSDFSRQNVISSLSIVRTAGGHRLELWPCYGLAGWIECEKLSIALRPVDSLPEE